MRFLLLTLALCFAASAAIADEQPKNEPSNDKAEKTYKEAVDLLKMHRVGPAMEAFKKADKQDGGHCFGCQKQMISLGTRYGEWKTAEQGAQEMIADAHGAQAIAIAHYQMASVLMAEGFDAHKQESFKRAHDEIGAALAAFANFPDAFYLDGRALAQLHQDEAAKARFEQFAKTQLEKDPSRQRAERFIGNMDLARARMAPPFEVTTMDGQNLSMDQLQGKVVLIDFWATWCGPCREALPHIHSIADKFRGEPLILLSVNLDTDEKKWRDFVAEHHMTWPQYYDGGFSGTMAKSFGIHEIPHTFTIDADGIVQDEKIGDASIEGKLKKLLARAREIQSTQGR